jgi:cytochrome P450
LIADTDLVFDPFSETFFGDPYPTYKRMRDEAPVYYNPELDFYALSRYDDVALGQKDWTTYSSAYGIELNRVQEGQKVDISMLIMMDPPEHRRMRSLVNRVFTPRAIMSLEPMVRETVSGFLAECDPTGFDGVEDFAALFPVEIICKMLGVPAGERQQIRLWLDESLKRLPGGKMTPEGEQAGIEMGTYFYELITRRRDDLADDMISDLIRAEVVREDNGEPTRLDDVEIAGFVSLLGGAGAETVTKLIGNALVLFADHPEQWRMLQQDRSLIPSAVEEVLRYQAPSQYNVRRCVREHELHGTTIPEGAAVAMLVGSANRDERAFPDADRFDITRSTLDGAQNIGFGYGIHSCLGAALARLESRVALELLLDFMPEYDVDRSGLARVAMTNVAGWSRVPVKVG